jgi:hypothetical protein
MSKFKALSALAFAAIVAVGCSDISDLFSPESARTPGFSEAEVSSSDTNDPSPSGIAARLSSSARVLSNIDKRLDKINAGWQPPPDDSKPPIRAALANVITQANAILAVAAEIEAKLGTPPTDTPDD